MRKKALILGNGDNPGKNAINRLTKMGFDTIVCADGGADTAKELKVIPQYIIGDLDSVSPKTLKYFDGKTTVVIYKRQEDTDVEKCIKFIMQKKFTELVLTGCTGSRLDHTLTNISIALKYIDRLRLYLIHQDSVMQGVTGTVLFKSVPGETISVFGIGKETIISSSGLQYPITNQQVSLGEFESQSNVAIGKKFALNIENGKAIVVRDYENWVKCYK